MKLRILLFFLLFPLLLLNGQGGYVESKMDSLQQLLRQKQLSDQERLAIYTRLIWRWSYAQRDSAQKYLKEYMVIAAMQSDKKYMARAADYQGRLALDAGDYQKAAQAARKRIQIGQESSNFLHISGGYSDLGNTYLKMGLLDSALIAYQLARTTVFEARKVDSSRNYVVPEARSLINISETYKLEGKYVQALETIQYALKLCHDYKLVGFLASCYNLEGEIYLEVKDFEKANRSFKKSIEQAQRSHNLNRLALAYELLAKAEIAQTKYKEAEAHLFKSIETGEKAQLKSIKGRAIWKLGELYYLQKKHPLALKMIAEAEAYLKLHQAPLELMQAKRIKGNIYNSLGNFPKAKLACLQAEKLNQNTGQKSDEMEICRCLYHAYKGNQEWKNAMTSLERYDQLKDSLMNYSISREITQLQEQQFYQAQLFNDSLKNLKQISGIELEHQKEVTQQNRIISIVAASTAIALIILLFLSILYRNNKKKQQQLRSQNELIKQQKEALSNSLEQKEILLKEIHHRVKNNLQVISSLLELQSNNTTDNNAADALLQGQARVKSMALIHQKLYQTEDVATVNLYDYVKDLSQYLQSIYPQAATIQLELDIEKIHLDIDSAIPIGLIVNEIISNAFKYAIVDNPSPKLSIGIHAKEEGNYLLTYQDNGSGLPQGFDIRRSKSLGMRLIRRLVQQLFGMLELKSENGLKIDIHFKDTALRKLED